MSNVQQLPIGVFDSGVGGLSVLKVLQEQFPNEDFIYIGDNANNPVGNRSDDEITYLACRIAETLEKQPVKLMVIACNTFNTDSPPTPESNTPIGNCCTLFIRHLLNSC